MIGNGVEATPIGQVEIESGMLVLSDAVNLHEIAVLAELEAALPGESPGTSIPNSTGTFAAVVARAPDELAIGKDAYPVFLLRDRGKSVGLFVDFGTRSEDPPDPL